MSNTTSVTIPFFVLCSSGSSVCIQHRHHCQNHDEHAHVNAAAHDQNLCQSSVSPGGIAQGVCVWVSECVCVGVRPGRTHILSGPRTFRGLSEIFFGLVLEMRIGFSFELGVGLVSEKESQKKKKLSRLCQWWCLYLGPKLITPSLPSGCKVRSQQKQ